MSSQPVVSVPVQAPPPAMSAWQPSARGKALREYLTNFLEVDSLFADGFEEAVIGHGYTPGRKTLVVYDYDKCVEVLMARDGMSHEEATEWMEFNVEGAYAGEHTPVFLHKIEDEELDLPAAEHVGKIQ